MCKHIKHICEILSPEYDFLRIRVDDYVSTKLTNCIPFANTPYPATHNNTTQHNNNNNNNTNNDNSCINTPPPHNDTTTLVPASPSLADNYSYSYMNNDLNMNVMDLNVVNLIDLSAVEGMWVNVMNS